MIFNPAKTGQVFDFRLQSLPNFTSGSGNCTATSLLPITSNFFVRFLPTALVSIGHSGSPFRNDEFARTSSESGARAATSLSVFQLKAGQLPKTKEQVAQYHYYEYKDRTQTELDPKRFFVDGVLFTAYRGGQYQGLSSRKTRRRAIDMGVYSGNFM